MFKYKGMSLQNPRLRKRLRRVPLTFTRASVGYDKYGNSVPVDTPRFGIAGGPNDGVLIEEAHTNLLTADVSQALTTESPYTTGTLDGTYTFSCMTGSYELSGGATGTVTPTSPQTKTITSATVTLTGDATYNQITATAYPLSWTLGGTTMAKEELTAPAVMNNTTGTIECEILANNIIKTDGLNNYFIDTADGDGNNRITILDDSSNNVAVNTKADGGITSVTYADSNLTLDTVHKVGATYNASNLKLFTDGTSRENPELLTPNQQTGTDTLGNTEGFKQYRTSTLSSTTEQAHTGTRSLKVVTSGTQANEGYYTPSQTITPDKTYTVSKWVLAPNGQKMLLSVHDGTAFILNTQFTGTGTWQYIEGNFTTTNTNIYTYIRTDGTNAITFYVDDLSFKAMSSPPNLPASKQTIYLGSKYDGTLQANTLIRNVVLTKQDRVDGDITNRSYRDGFGVDRQVTLIAPLKNNLNAYRVATV